MYACCAQCKHYNLLTALCAEFVFPFFYACYDGCMAFGYHKTIKSLEICCSTIFWTIFHLWSFRRRLKMSSKRPRMALQHTQKKKKKEFKANPTICILNWFNFQFNLLHNVFKLKANVGFDFLCVLPNFSLYWSYSSALISREQQRYGNT